MWHQSVIHNQHFWGWILPHWHWNTPNFCLCTPTTLCSYWTSIGPIKASAYAGQVIGHLPIANNNSAEAKALDFLMSVPLVHWHPKKLLMPMAKYLHETPATCGAAGEWNADEHGPRRQTVGGWVDHPPREHQRWSSVVSLPSRRGRAALRKHGQRRLRTHDRLAPVSRRGLATTSYCI